MNKKILGILLLLSSNFISCNDTATSLAGGNIFYPMVGELVLQSEDYIKPNVIKPLVESENEDDNEDDNEDGVEETKEEKAAKFLRSLSDVKQKELLFNLFTRKGMFTVKEKSLEDYSLQELSIIRGSDLSGKASLYRSIDRTETIVGSTVLSTMLALPTSDLELIRNRQEMIRLLLEDEKLFNKLNSLIKQVKKYQNSLLNCWNSEAALDENLRDIFYHRKGRGSSYLNKSPKKHQLKRLWMLGGWGTNMVGLPTSIISNIVFMYFVIDAGENGFDVPFTTFRIPPLIFAPYKNFVRFAVVAAGASYIGSQLYSFKMNMDQAKLINSILFNIHKRLKDISAIIKSFEDIVVTVKGNEGLEKGLLLINNMSVFISDAKSFSPKLNYLKQLLREPVFKQKKFGLFSHAGNVLAAYKYLNEVKDRFASPLEAFGEIDACLSIVKLIKEHQKKSVGFCFVDFVEQEEPLLDLKGVWSTLVGVSKAKPADIVLGGTDNANNAMFTGPNGSGKSILMKSAVSCDILGRTFGIAPAKEARMTLFNKVYTYVNVKEDPQLDKSLFMAEKARGVDIMHKLASNPHEKVLIIIDEPYNGTISESGETLTYDLAAEIGKHSNAISLIATHRRKPAELADENNNTFANYHLLITEDEKGKITRTFELQKGKCEWWYNDAEKRDRYIKTFEE